MSDHCQVDNFEVVTSPLTSRAISVNLDPERFLIMPQASWDASKLTGDLRALKATGAWQRNTASSRHFRKIIKALMDAPSRDVLTDFIDTMMAEKQKWGVAVVNKDSETAWAHARPWNYRDKTRFTEVLAVFWKAGALALPREPVAEFKGARFTLDLDWNTLVQDKLREEGVKLWPSSTDKVSELHDVLLTCCPVVSIGDIVPDLINALPRRPHPNIRLAFRGLCKVIKDMYGEPAPSADDYWPAALPLHHDLKFGWVTALDPEMSVWAELASRWLGTQGSAIATKHQSLRIFLKCLLDRPQLPRRPHEFLQRTSFIDRDVGVEYLDANRTNGLVDFIDWVIANECSTRRADGTLMPADGVGNPFEKKKNVRLAESVRNVMPPWLLKMLVECLVADDWSWAKSALAAPKSVNKGDWFYKAQLDDTSSWVWCPARAVALYAKLTFPSRQGQTRHLDSGEADAEIATFNPDAPEGRSWSMRPNPCRIPSALKAAKLTKHEERRLDARAKGAIQVGSSETRNYLRLRFTTNKTADIGKDAWNRGYTSPWMPDDLAHKLLWLREWQKTNNPVVSTTRWDDVDEFTMGDTRKHPDVLRGMDSAFLFRDATLDRPDHPVTNAKVRNLYGALCAEVERRCADIGLRGTDGQPIKLVATTTTKYETPSGLVYPLHALRVSIVTHFVEEGGVSPEVMMKIVGHATVVMTMLYIKHNGEYIADAMMRGNEKLKESARQQWVNVARDKELDALRTMAFGASDAAYASFRSAPAGSLLPLNVGICPTGGGRCHEGGSRIFDRKFEDVYAPVQGGRSNCAGCRFLLTGEPWLEGIVSEFNLRSLDLSLKNRHLSRLDEWLLPLDDERAECMKAGRLFVGLDEWSALTKEKEEIEFAQQQLHGELANLMVLDQQIRRLAESRAVAGETRMALVVGDFASVETALQESCEFDLVDRICRSVDVFPSLVARGTAVVTATMFRARAWDRVLRQNGLEPRFLDLSPEEGRRVGNRLTEWLDFRIGRPGTIALMEGSATIAEICRRTGLLSENLLGEIGQEIDARLPMRLAPRHLQPRPAIGFAPDAAAE